MSATLPVHFQTLARHCASLSDEQYWEVETLGDPELEEQLRAAAHVTHGGSLHKFRKSGREKPHRRFVRVASSAAGRRPALYSTAGVRRRCEPHLDNVARILGYDILLLYKFPRLRSDVADALPRVGPEARGRLNKRSGLQSVVLELAVFDRGFCFARRCFDVVAPSYVQRTTFGRTNDVRRTYNVRRSVVCFVYVFCFRALRFAYARRCMLCRRSVVRTAYGRFSQSKKNRTTTWSKQNLPKHRTKIEQRKSIKKNKSMFSCFVYAF